MARFNLVNEVDCTFDRYGHCGRVMLDASGPCCCCLSNILPGLLRIFVALALGVGWYTCWLA